MKKNTITRGTIKKAFARLMTFIIVMPVLLTPQAVQAASYKDIPAGSWSYAAVDYVSEKGYMVGDLSGNFNPNNQIDKFETTKIFAKLNGYKHTGATAEEQAYYNACYDKHKSYINQYVAKFKRWNSSVNNEIAFLLEKGVLISTDLNKFVVITKGTDGIDTERLYALQREEAFVFVVRTLGKESQALASTSTKLFKDDATITAEYKKYVYYCLDNGIISFADNVKPKDAINRASFATLLHNAAGKPATTPPTNPPTTTDYKTITGTIAQTYTSFRGLQITSTDPTYNNTLYKVIEAADIRINGTVKQFADLAIGMSFTAVVSKSEIISIIVTSTQVTTPPVPVTQNSIEGIINDVKSDTTGQYITLELSILSPKGEVLSEKRVYRLDSTCTITRGETKTAFSGIAINDIALVKVAGDVVYSISLTEKNRSFTAILTKKEVQSATNTPIYTVTESNGKVSTLKLSPTADLSRYGSGYVGWNDIRLGDTLQINTEYDVITDLYATGTRSTVDIWVKDIYISNDIAKITGVDTANKEKDYYLISGLLDVYSVRVGTQIRARLDSSEVESYAVISTAKSNTFTGTVTYYSSTSLTVKDSSSSYPVTSEFKIDSSTVFFDSITGRTISYNGVGSGMRVFVVLSDTNSNYAKTVSILNY